MAQIYEQQGLKEDALGIYEEILKKDPSSREARNGILRLSGGRRHFNGVNVQMKEFFISMSTKPEFDEFERWLARSWN